MQTPIPSLFMRGNTWAGAYFNAADKTVDIPTRDRLVVAAMRASDERPDLISAVIRKGNHQ